MPVKASAPEIMFVISKWVEGTLENSLSELNGTLEHIQSSLSILQMSPREGKRLTKVVVFKARAEPMKKIDQLKLFSMNGLLFAEPFGLFFLVPVRSFL